MTDKQSLWGSLIRFWRGLALPVRLGGIAVGIALMVLLVVLVWPRGGGSAAGVLPYPTAYGVLYSFPPAEETGSPPLLLADGRFSFEPGWGALEVRSFLASRPGVLGDMYSWVGDREMPLADVITGYSLLYGINPKVVLALLEVQSGLLDDPDPSAETLDWAMGYRDEEVRGLEAQIDWAVRELFRSRRDYPAASLLLQDGGTVPVPEGANLGSYAVLRVVAQTGDEARLQQLMGTGPEGFVGTYRSLFGGEEDPRRPLEVPAGLADRPFLSQPYTGTYRVTSIFDHQSPLLRDNGIRLSHWGQDAVGLPSDGHNGWDYALDHGVPVVAAADGVIVWAGNSDDGCATASRGVILDHQNGYRTLYWHLSQVDVQVGQRVSRGDVLGLAGASGCSQGPHLHFQVQFLGRDTDPEGWCGEQEDPWAAHPAGTVSQWLWMDRYCPCAWPAEAIVVDETDAGFQREGTRWFEGGGGVGGGALWAPSEPRSGVVPAGNPGTLDGVVEIGTWRPNLPASGLYRVYAFVPYWFNNTPDTQSARYLVHHDEGETLVVIDQSRQLDRWVDLGAYRFAGGRQGFVSLDNLTDETGFGVWFDAVMWVPQE